MSEAIQVVQLRSDRAVVYYERSGASAPVGNKKGTLTNLQGKRFKGTLSDVARKKMEKAIVQWSSTLNYALNQKTATTKALSKKLIFVTLTLPSEQKHSDSEIKRECLNHFLIAVARRWKAIDYVWKAEYQQNGNIHFHILFDQFLPHIELRKLWNFIIEKLGLISDFEHKHHHRNPNTTDIHIVRDLSSTIRYCRKYMTKSDSCRLEGGRVWGCSDRIGRLQPLTMPLCNEVSQLLSAAAAAVDIRQINKECVTMFFGDFGRLIKEVSPSIWTEFIASLRDNWNATLPARVEKSLLDLKTLELFKQRDQDRAKKVVCSSGVQADFFKK